MIEPISNELNDLVLNGLRDSNGTIWTINPYFSSDWKFMAIVLGFNAPNSKHFCPWCLCTKENIGNKHKVCVIEKTMDQIKLKPPPGHVKSPLLQMIPLSHYVPDEAKILAKMRRISISFNFWQEQGTQNWSYTSLMGEDKEKVLKNFNFRVVFAEERAFLINQLWRNFYELYNNMKSQKINPSHFADQAKQWLDLFLTPFQGEPNTITFKMGLYRPKDVTPYMHVLVHHLPEFMEQHQKFGLSAFSCAPVEKKNHDQVSAFF
uniref:Transposase domain-containing protein n=1 Tax=Rhizophagus irregularis (strain DAOM 181602 / DAOM 197198 / MUCL 43194) TaxID=747089 RepID=U9T8A2_RHIID